MPDGVELALAEVDRDFYVREPDGSVLPQTSAPHVIERMLRLLEVHEGGRVLEVGTGSGFSTALLSVLVGAAGAVVSMDVDVSMVHRAEGLLRLDGRANVTVVCADGRMGYPPRAPYDRLVAWASCDEAVPSAWTEQVSPGGLIIAPIQRASTQAIHRLRVTAAGAVVHESVTEGSFIPLTAQPFRPWEAESG